MLHTVFFGAPGVYRNMPNTRTNHSKLEKNCVFQICRNFHIFSCLSKKINYARPRGHLRVSPFQVFHPQKVSRYRNGKKKSTEKITQKGHEPPLNFLSPVIFLPINPKKGNFSMRFMVLILILIYSTHFADFHKQRSGIS